MFAAGYDCLSAAFNDQRRQMVELLTLRPGDVVLDVGCGTGLCFPYVEAAIGRTGSLIGVEPSRAMLQRAQAQIDRHAWHNVILVHASAEEAQLSRRWPDAVLFCAVHDVLRSPAALENLFRQVNPGARVAAVGGKWTAPRLLGLNALVALAHAPFVTSFEGFDRPWSHLQRFVPNLQVTPTNWDTGYLASGAFSAIGLDSEPSGRAEMYPARQGD